MPDTTDSTTNDATTTPGANATPQPVAANAATTPTDAKPVVKPEEATPATTPIAAPTPAPTPTPAQPAAAPVAPTPVPPVAKPAEETPTPPPVTPQPAPSAGLPPRQSVTPPPAGGINLEAATSQNPLPATPGVAPGAVPGATPSANQERKPQIKNVQKRGSRIGVRGFVIGCFIFLVIVFGIIGLGLYYIIQNPEQVGGNINIDTVKQGLNIFAALFFGFLFFFGFGIVVVNAYRLSTRKEGSRIGYIFGVFMGLILLGGSIGGGIFVLQAISNIAGSDVPQTNNIVLAKVPTGAGERFLHSSPGLQIIAPSSLTFELNRTVFDRTMLNTIAGNEIQRVELDCGNEQTLTADVNSYQFFGSCLFLEKGNFPVQLIVSHIDRSNGVQQETVIPAGTVGVPSKLDLTTALGDFTLNDAGTEINVGKAPAKVLFDANKIFEDYGIAEYQIDWDVEGDGVRDKENDVAFAHNYKRPGLIDVLYTIPELGDYVYKLSFRVAQNDVPICEVFPQLIQETTYNLSVQCDDLNTPIVEYNFEVFDFDNGKTVSTEKSKRPTLRYTFSKGGDYLIKLTYLTNEGKKGYFETDTISIGKVTHDVDYTIMYRGANEDKFEAVNANNSEQVYVDGTELIVKELPVDIKVTINSINPVSSITKAQVFYEGQPVLSTDDENFEFTIDMQGNQEAEIVVTEGDDTEATTNLLIPIILDQSEIIGKLIAIGGTVGFDPFEAKLDASTTTLTDPEDEIIYFTWDFGDGEIKRNTSQGQIEHTYVYDGKNENGEYNPTVTIKTKKGLETTIELDNPILVKKRAIKASIRSDSHLSQIAGIGESIALTLTTDGDPTTIVWDFGDGNTLECSGRACLETKAVYENPGEYEVTAEIQYTDGNQTTTEGLTFIVEAD